MTSTANRVIPMPADAAARRERQLRAKWAEKDRLLRRIREIDAEAMPLQREVSADQGYGFTVGREALELCFRAREARERS